MKQETHSLFGHTSATTRLKSRRSSVQPIDLTAKTFWCNQWKKRLHHKAHIGIVKLFEDLATRHESKWLTWRCLNKLRTKYTFSKEQKKKWWYFDGDSTCKYGLATENTAHMLKCTLQTLLTHP